MTVNLIDSSKFFLDTESISSVYQKDCFVHCHCNSSGVTGSDSCNLFKDIPIIKGYLHYKTITSLNVPSKAQIKIFFIS